MRRFMLAGLFVISLFSMLCIGFVLGALFTPVFSRAVNLAERVITNNRLDRNFEPKVFINPPRMNERNFIQQGAPIVRVISGSPADQAGLQVGDTIVAFDGQTINNGRDLANALANHKPGDTVKLKVMQRNGEKREVSLDLGENPERKGISWLGIQYGTRIQVPFEGQAPSLPDRNDPQQPALPQDEFPFLPGMEHPGALIREVMPGSPAEKAGLKPGQLIQSVDGKEINSTNNLAEVIATYKPGDTVTLTVFEAGTTAGQPLEITVKLGENPDQQGSAWLGVRFVVIDINIQPDPGPQG